MSLVQIDYNPSRPQLAVFGAVWLVFFGVAGGIVLGRGEPGWAGALGLLAVVVPLVGWRAPRFMRFVYVAMALLAFPMGFMVSYLVLAAVYYLVMTPIGLLLRLVGYDPLNRRFDRAAKSYWTARHAADMHRYFRQF